MKRRIFKTSSASHCLSRNSAGGRSELGSCPAVTCAIPATSRVDHMRQNMGAAHGRLPDAALRARMIGHIESL